MSPSGFPVRDATPKDAGGIARVYVDSWRETYAGLLPDRMLVDLSVPRLTRQMRYRIDWIRRNPRTLDLFLVAFDGREVVGFADCGPSRTPSLGPKAEIYTLYVDPNYLDQGVGKTVLVEAMRRFLENNATSLIIWALEKNPYRHFYGAVGGKLAAEREGRHWGRQLREIGYAWTDLEAAHNKLVDPASH